MYVGEMVKNKDTNWLDLTKHGVWKMIDILTFIPWIIQIISFIGWMWKIKKILNWRITRDNQRERIVKKHFAEKEKFSSWNCLEAKS
jgi:hypothetical protein